MLQRDRYKAVLCPAASGERRVIRQEPCAVCSAPSISGVQDELRALLAPTACATGVPEAHLEPSEMLHSRVSAMRTTCSDDTQPCCEHLIDPTSIGSFSSAATLSCSFTPAAWGMQPVVQVLHEDAWAPGEAAVCIWDGFNSVFGRHQKDEAQC
jgi:hypothetical protein